MTGPIDYCRAVVAAAGEHRQLHIRCHADGSLDFIRAFDGGPIPTQAEIEAAWAAMPEPPRTVRSSDVFDLLTKQERKAIRTSNDDDVQDFLFRLMVNPTFQSNSTNFSSGITLLVSKGILTQNRAQQVAAAIQNPTP
jgi:hypothetical protein